MYFRLVSILISSLLLLSTVGCDTSQESIASDKPIVSDVDNPHFKTYNDTLKSIQQDWVSANKRINAVYAGVKSHALKKERGKLLYANNRKREVAKQRAWFTYRDAMLSDDEKGLISEQPTTE